LHIGIPVFSEIDRSKLKAEKNERNGCKYDRFTENAFFVLFLNVLSFHILTIPDDILKYQIFQVWIFNECFVLC